MLVRRICTSLSHIHLNPLPIPTKPRNFHLKSNPVPRARFPNQSKNPTSLTHQSRFSSSNYQMADARRPPAVPIPDPARADRAELLCALETSLGSPFSHVPLAPQPYPMIMVISGPSGVGKDAVIKRLREVRENLHFVVTATSRPIRPGEVNGKDYFFVTKEEFLAMVDKDDLLEYALVYGDYKGIPKQQIREYMARGYDIVLRVDIQGAATLRKILGRSAVFVFITAESEYAMVNRLVDRKTETKESLLVRIATAREEVQHASNFDYVVVNAEGKLEEAVRLVESIIDAEKAKVTRKNVMI